MIGVGKPFAAKLGLLLLILNIIKVVTKTTGYFVLLNSRSSGNSPITGTVMNSNMIK